MVERQRSDAYSERDQKMHGKNVIAIIFDLDGTISSDDTITFVLKAHSVSALEFWKDVADKVAEGWDPTLAYIRNIIEEVRTGKLKGLTNEKLRKLGSKLTFYRGVPSIFEELRALVEERFSDANLSVEFYVITGGLEEVVRGSVIARHMTDIFGCTFYEDPKRGISFPKSIVTFTERTKYIFSINKGVSEIRSNPFALNALLPETERRVPFENMIYIGDGPSDIPCMSLVTKNGGHAIGILEERRYPKAFELTLGRRATMGPFMPDYGKGGELWRLLETLIEHVAWRIYGRARAVRVG